MKYCRFQQNTQAHYGLVESVAGRDAIVRILLTSPEESGGDVESLRTRRIEPIALEEAALLPPVTPSKIVCVGRNYREHAAELGNEVPTEPLLFFKPPSSLLAPGGTILRPKVSERTDYEGELGVVIAKRCHKLPDDEDTRPYILGYTCVNDFTARTKTANGQEPRASIRFAPSGPSSLRGLLPGPAFRWKPASTAKSDSPAIPVISSFPSASSCATFRRS